MLATPAGRETLYKAARTPNERFWVALDSIATDQEPGLARAIREALDKLKRTLTLRDIENAVQWNDPRLILGALDLEALQFSVREAIASSAERILGSMQSSVRIRFDILNPKVIDAIRAQELQTVQFVGSEAQEGVRQAMQAGLSRGWNPRRTALLVRESIGLPPRLVQAVANYRTSLEELDSDALRRGLRDARFDPSVRRAIDLQEPLSASEVDVRVQRYLERAQRHNAETIARTESMDALHTAQRASWSQLIDAGKVDSQVLRRFWIVAMDERTCEVCRPIPALNPDGRTWDEPFITPMGPMFRPTAHPNCRCVILVKIVES